MFIIVESQKHSEFLSNIIHDKNPEIKILIGGPSSACISLARSIADSRRVKRSVALIDLHSVDKNYKNQREQEKSCSNLNYDVYFCAPDLFTDRSAIDVALKFLQGV